VGRIWRLLERRKRDQGFTLIELVIAMSIFGLLMAITYSVLTSVQRQTSRTLATSDDVAQVRLALQQIDRQVRSGNVLYSPANEVTALTGTPDCYSFTVAPSAVPNAGNCMRVYTQANGDNRCVQWRIRGGELATRSWAPDAPSGVSSWRVVAHNIVNTNSTGPAAFSLQGATTSYGARLVDIHVLVRTAGSTAAPVEVTTSLAGRNTEYGFDPGTCSPPPPSS
jgi:prepilin-type N-terminal cleavage/methylation domain-containing protein